MEPALQTTGGCIWVLIKYNLSDNDMQDIFAGQHLIKCR
jgi:hypothetical protein